MAEDFRARIPEQTAMDVVERALSEVGDDTDRVVVICLDKEGDSINFFSNARSEAELNGMLHMCLFHAEDLSDD